MTLKEDWTDDTIRDVLKEIDEDEDIDVNEWEAGFIESIVFRYTGPLSDAQREKALQLIDKYD